MNAVLGCFIGDTQAHNLSFRFSLCLLKDRWLPVAAVAAAGVIVPWPLGRYLCPCDQSLARP